MPESLRVFIVEDEKQSLDLLESYLLRSNHTINIIGSAPSVAQAISNISKNKPELVFMDIKLTDGTSFEILDHFKNRDFEVVFITGYHNFYEKAFEHFALNYLTKPINFENLTSVIDRYVTLKEKSFTNQKFEQFKNFIQDKDAWFLLHIGITHVSVQLKNIVKCEADGNYTNFYLVDGAQHMASKSMKYFESILSFKGFIRINRSTIINIQYIKSIYKKETIHLSTGEKIHISNRYKSKVDEFIKAVS